MENENKLTISECLKCQMKYTSYTPVQCPCTFQTIQPITKGSINCMCGATFPLGSFHVCPNWITYPNTDRPWIPK